MKEKKLTPRQEESLRKKKLIFETSIELFREYGYDNTTIQDICKSTGVSVGSIYHFFSNGKDDILQMLARQEISDCGHIVELSPENIRDPLTAIFNFFVETARGFDRIGVELTKPLRAMPTESIGRARNDILSPLIEAAQKAGTFDDSISPKETSDYFFIACEGMICAWIYNGGKETLEQSTRRFMPRLLETFRRSPTPEAAAADNESV